MKKLLITLSLLLATTASHASLKVLTCEPEWAALTLALGGDLVQVESATTAQQDPHNIQARPSLIARARQADLLVCTGAELEAGWLPLLLQKSANRRIQPGQPGHFLASRHVRLTGAQPAADRSHGHVHAAGNPHIQTDPHNLMAVADALLPVLQQLLPAHKDELAARHAAFRQEMAAAFTRWQPRIQALQGLTIVVHHDNWVYLNRWLGLQQVATLEPLPGVPPSAAHLATLLAQLRAEPASLIVHTTYQDGKAAQWLAARTGIPAMALPSTVDHWQAPGALVSWYDNLLTRIEGGAP